MSNLVPVMSLSVATLAVFVGPLVSWIVAKRTLRYTQLSAAWQLIIPIRQAWLSELRTRLAEMAGLSLHYFVDGFDDRTDEEYRRLQLLEQEIAFMLDIDNPEHQALLGAIRQAVEAIGGRRGPEDHDRFARAHTNLTELARRMVQAEWRSLAGEPKSTALHRGA